MNAAPDGIGFMISDIFSTSLTTMLHASLVNKACEITFSNVGMFYLISGFRKVKHCFIINGC